MSTEQTTTVRGTNPDHTSGWPMWRALFIVDEARTDTWTDQDWSYFAADEQSARDYLYRHAGREWPLARPGYEVRVLSLYKVAPRRPDRLAHDYATGGTILLPSA